MTEFLEDHPGGSEIITSNRSKDVTSIFNPRHPSDQLDSENLPPSVEYLGILDTESASDEDKEAIRLKVSADEEEEGARIEREREEMEERGLGVIVNMRDFEVGQISCHLLSRFSRPPVIDHRHQMSMVFNAGINADIALRNTPSRC